MFSSLSSCAFALCAENAIPVTPLGVVWMEGTGETAGTVPLKVPRSWEAHATRDKTVIIKNTLFIETPDWLEVGFVLSDKRLTMQSPDQRYNSIQLDTCQLWIRTYDISATPLAGHRPERIRNNSPESGIRNFAHRQVINSTENSEKTYLSFYSIPC